MLTKSRPQSTLIVNEALEGLCCVTQAKWHPCKFKQPEGCGDSCLVDIQGFNWDLVVTSRWTMGE